MATPYPTGSREVRRQVSDERAIELVTTCAQESLRYNESLFSKLQSYYNIFRGVKTGGAAKFRNDITIPFTLAMIESLVSRKVMSLFGQWPPVAFEGYAPEDQSRANRNAALIGAQLKDAGSLIRACDFFLSDAICGTAIARVGWKTIQRMNRLRRKVNLAPDLDIMVIEEGRVTQFDGPVWEVVDRMDYWQQPCVIRMEEGWGIHRYWVDLDDLKEDAASDYPYFDQPGAIAKLEASQMQPSSVAEYNMRRMTFRNEIDYQMRRALRFSKPVEIMEFHGPVPAEFAFKGVRHLCIAIGNGSVLLKYREGPLGNGQKPFLKYCSMPDPYSFDGIGKAEVAYGPQRTADRLNNQRLDAIDLLIDPQYVANSSAGINFNNLFSRAGRVIMVDGPADESQIRALSPDMRGVQIGAEEVGRLFSFMQLGTGETEALLGLSGGSSRETARGFLGRQENALNRLALETTLGGEFVEDLANMFRHMDYLWLTLPHEIKILGSAATVNPLTGLPYPAESHTIDMDDLTPSYRARAIGPTQMIGKGVRQQNMIALLQMMSSNPVLLQSVNWANFARQAFELFDFKNLNDLLVTKVPAINMMADQAGMSPEAMAGAVSQPLSDLDPQVLSQMTNRQTPAPLSMAGMVG